VAAANGFQIRPGQATFLNEHTLAVEGQPLPARSYLLATGSRAAVPDLPGLARIDWLTSTTAMELKVPPDSLVVIDAAGAAVRPPRAEVTVVGRLAPRAEPELADRLRSAFADDGITAVEEHAATVHPEHGEVWCPPPRAGRCGAGGCW
jgi:mercuric reductase